MNKNFEIILNFRKYLLKKIEGLSAEQLNHIPEKHNNNIIWHLAHLEAVLQALCYKSAGQPITIEEKYFIPFLPGTKPAAFISDEAIQTIKKQLIESIGQLETDFEMGKFKSYNKIEKIQQVYHIEVATIEDAVKYLIHHEGMHFGAISSLMRALN